MQRLISVLLVLLSLIYNPSYSQAQNKDVSNTTLHQLHDEGLPLSKDKGTTKGELETRTEQVAQYLQALYGIAFLGGIVAATERRPSMWGKILGKLVKPARVVVPVAAATSFALRSMLAFNSYKNDCSELNKCSKRERNVRIYSIILNALAAPIAAFGSAPVMQAIAGAGGWKLFVPFKGWSRKVSIHASTGFAIGRFTDAQMHRARGINPAKSRNFWLNSADNVLGLLLNGLALIAAGKNSWGGKLKAALAVSATYTLYSIWSQNLVQIFTGKKPMIEHHYYNNQNAAFHSIPRSFLEWGIFWAVHNKVSSAAAASAITSTYKIIDVLQKNTWYAKSKLRFIEEDMNFFQAMSELPDYRDLFRLSHKKKESR